MAVLQIKFSAISNARLVMQPSLPIVKWCSSRSDGYKMTMFVLEHGGSELQLRGTLWWSVKLSA